MYMHRYCACMCIDRDVGEVSSVFLDSGIRWGEVGQREKGRLLLSTLKCFVIVYIFFFYKEQVQFLSLKHFSQKIFKNDEKEKSLKLNQNLITWCSHFVLHSEQLEVTLFLLGYGSKSLTWYHPWRPPCFSSPRYMFLFSSALAQFTVFPISLSSCHAPLS